jgi:hypothetical protein
MSRAFEHHEATVALCRRSATLEDMSVYIDSGDRLHHEQAATLALTCPHCLVVSHVTAQSVPRFSELTAVRPKQIGIVYRCDACNSPIFLRFNVRNYTPARIELSAQFTEIERPQEKFSYTYLPEPIEVLFRETLGCYSHGALNAFVSMCRRTMQAVFFNAGESGRLRVFDELNDVRDMAEIDADSFALIKRVVFGTDADPSPGLPLLDDDQCGLLLEVMKDLLYQTYVRKGHLQQAMVVRRFFSEERSQIDGNARVDGSARA